MKKGPRSHLKYCSAPFKLARRSSPVMSSDCVIRTGPVRASGFESRFRRAAYAAAAARHPEIPADLLNAEIDRVSAALHRVIAERHGLSKGAVIAITATFSAEGGRPAFRDLHVDVYSHDGPVSDLVSADLRAELDATVRAAPRAREIGTA